MLGNTGFVMVQQQQQQLQEMGSVTDQKQQQQRPVWARVLTLHASLQLQQPHSHSGPEGLQLSGLQLELIDMHSTGSTATAPTMQQTSPPNDPPRAHGYPAAAEAGTTPAGYLVVSKAGEPHPCLRDWAALLSCCRLTHTTVSPLLLALLLSSTATELQTRRSELLAATQLGQSSRVHCPASHPHASLPSTTAPLHVALPQPGSDASSPSSAATSGTAARGHRAHVADAASQLAHLLTEFTLQSIVPSSAWVAALQTLVAGSKASGGLGPRVSDLPDALAVAWLACSSRWGVWERPSSTLLLVALRTLTRAATSIPTSARTGMRVAAASARPQLSAAVDKGPPSGANVATPSSSSSSSRGGGGTAPVAQSACLQALVAACVERQAQLETGDLCFLVRTLATLYGVQRRHHRTAQHPQPGSQHSRGTHTRTRVAEAESPTVGAHSAALLGEEVGEVVDGLEAWREMLRCAVSGLVDRAASHGGGSGARLAGVVASNIASNGRWGSRWWEGVASGDSSSSDAIGNASGSSCLDDAHIASSSSSGGISSVGDTNSSSTGSSSSSSGTSSRVGHQAVSSRDVPQLRRQHSCTSAEQLLDIGRALLAATRVHRVHLPWQVYITCVLPWLIPAPTQPTQPHPRPSEPRMPSHSSQGNIHGNAPQPRMLSQPSRPQQQPPSHRHAATSPGTGLNPPGLAHADTSPPSQTRVRALLPHQLAELCHLLALSRHQPPRGFTDLLALALTPCLHAAANAPPLGPLRANHRAGIHGQRTASLPAQNLEQHQPHMTPPSLDLASSTLCQDQAHTHTGAGVPLPSHGGGSSDSETSSRIRSGHATLLVPPLARNPSHLPTTVSRPSQAQSIHPSLERHSDSPLTTTTRSSTSSVQSSQQKPPTITRGQAPGLTARDISSLAWSLTHVPAWRRTETAPLLQSVAVLYLAGMDSQGVGMTLWALACQRRAIADEEVAVVLGQARRVMQAADAQALSDILWGTVTLQLLPDHAWLQQHCACLSLNLAGLSLSAVSHVLWSYGAIVYPPPYAEGCFKPPKELVEKLMRTLTRRLPSLTPDNAGLVIGLDLAHLAFGIARICPSIVTQVWLKRHAALSRLQLRALEEGGAGGGSSMVTRQRLRDKWGINLRVYGGQLAVAVAADREAWVARRQRLCGCWGTVLRLRRRVKRRQKAREREEFQDGLLY
ncbi:MAG: hypothetical protein WDW36_004447 [Sanguina aurantia]